MANKLPPVATFCKSRVRTAAMLCVLSILLAGCQPDIESVEPTPNPNPKEIYEITVTVENAPGEFTSAEAMVAYAPLPRECLPPAPPFSMTDSSGVTSWKEEKPSIKRLSPTTFVTRVIFDAYIPKNDYGLGLCKWQPKYVVVRLYNGINKLDISTSSSGLREQEYVKEATIIDWFTKAETTELVKTGREVNKGNAYQYPPSDYFYVTLNANKVSQ